MNDRTTILNVDDYEVNRYARSRVLRSAGYHIVEAANGGDALRLAAEIKPALILLDVNLPDINGLEVCRRIKNDPATKSVFVLQISASLVEPQDKATALEGGADSYLTDPLEPAELLATIQALLRLQKAEENLRISEERLRLAAQTSGFGFHDYDVEKNDSYWSPELCKMSGVGENMAFNIEIIGKMIHPDDRDRVIEKMTAALKPGSTGEFADEFRVIRPDTGETRWFFNRSQTYFAGSGKNRRAMRNTGIVMDITDRKRSEEKLRETNAVLTAVNLNTPTLIYVKDLRGRLVSANPSTCRIIGKPLEEITGKTDFDYLEAKTAAEIRKNDARILARGATETFEETVESEDGRRIFLSTKTPYRNETGEIIGLIGVSVDITERKQNEAERQLLLEATESARREAETANRSKDEFLAVLSHELRAPLNAMFGWTKILQANELDAERTRQAIEVIARNISLQNTLIEDLLDASRIISGKMRIEPEPTSLHSIVSAAIEAARPGAEKRGIRIEIDLDPTADLLHGDKDRLQQAVGNLLVNAVKFTSGGGSVFVSTRRDQTQNIARIIVRDTGSGIEPEFLPFIFDRFRQADSSSKRRFGGLGLGLTIVKNLIELHGGTISAFSGGLGEGATFTIELPLIARQIASQSPEEALDSPAFETSLPDSLAGMRILVVDDDADSLDLLCFALKREGAQVLCRNSAEKAWEELRNNTFDLLISDLGMAGMDGYDLIKKVRERANESLSAIPAVALTGYVSAEDRERVLQAGFQAHLSKPVDIENLPNVILDVIRNK